MFLSCKNLLIVLLVSLSLTIRAVELVEALEKFKKVYPNHIKKICASGIVWVDNTFMAIDNSEAESSIDNVSLADQLNQPLYSKGIPVAVPQEDPGRVRYEVFFRKMYGDSPEEVEKYLTEVVWLSKVFGDDAPRIKVTTINNLHEKVENISAELEDLVVEKPNYIDFLRNPGTYYWRTIAKTNRLSAHSFGIALDINPSCAQYWQWDLKNKGLPISENTPLEYRNTVPLEIVMIFEKYGFIWGGKWYHYDTMHFEYRPELIEQ